MKIFKFDHAQNERQNFIPVKCFESKIRKKNLHAHNCNIKVHWHFCNEPFVGPVLYWNPRITSHSHIIAIWLAIDLAKEKPFFSYRLFLIEHLS